MNVSTLIAPTLHRLGPPVALTPTARTSQPEPIAVSIAVDSVGGRAIVRLVVNRPPEQLTKMYCHVTSFDGRVRTVESGTPVVVSRAGHSHYRIVIGDLAPGEYVFTTCAAAKNGVDAVASDIFTIRRALARS